VLGGFGADFGHKSGRRGGLLLTAVISTAIGIPAAFFPVMPTVPGFAAMFFVLVLSGTITSVVATTAIAVLIPNEERGACLAVFGVINAIIGMSLAPTIVTLGSWAMGGEQHLATSSPCEIRRSARPISVDARGRPAGPRAGYLFSRSLLITSTARATSARISLSAAG
jgi:MFS family permease